MSMACDNEGFLYPVVDVEECIDCHLCEKVCPVINQNAPRKPLEVFAAKNSDDAIRMSSSSGGIFTLLAEQAIDKGGVVFGACWDDEWNVKHDYAEYKEQLAKFRSSKYLQSVIGYSYQETEKFLKAGHMVMFTGTPCQIAGLKCFLRKDYENLLTVEVICHSVPSPRVWQQYLSEKLQSLKWERHDIHHISFRNKKSGWKNYSFVVENKNGNVFTELGCKNVFMRGFLADLYTRPSCYACPAKNLRSGSDITLGDFWGIDSLMVKLDDDKGISAITVNTDKGRKALNDIGVELYTVPYKELTNRNPALVKSTTVSKNRTDFFMDDEQTFEKKVVASIKVPFSRKMIVYHIMHRLIPNSVIYKLKRFIK